MSDFWITVEYALSLLSMKIPLILSFISIPFSLLAQFYTISPTRIHADSKPESIQLPVIIDSVAIEPSEIHDESQDTVSIQWCHPPLKGKLRVSSQYGNRRNPFGKKTAEKHSGIDLSAKSGSPIYAMLPGEVINIGYDSRSGNFIKLRHGNFTVSYCHLFRKPNIPIGSRVMPGQTVANVGSTGRSTGPHLHITLKRNGRVIDPTFLLDYIDKYQ